MSLISAEDARQRNNELLRSHAALGEMLKQIEHEILKSTNSKYTNIYISELVFS